MEPLGAVWLCNLARLKPRCVSFPLPFTCKCSSASLTALGGCELLHWHYLLGFGGTSFCSFRSLGSSAWSLCLALLVQGKQRKPLVWAARLPAFAPLSRSQNCTRSWDPCQIHSIKTLVTCSDSDGNSLHEEGGNNLGKGLPCSLKIHRINLKRKFYCSTSEGI